jgi:hypothetical protein
LGKYKKIHAAKYFIKKPKLLHYALKPLFMFFQKMIFHSWTKNWTFIFVHFFVRTPFLFLKK